jgi:hypothetical protein
VTLWSFGEEDNGDLITWANPTITTPRRTQEYPSSPIDRLGLDQTVLAKLDLRPND